MDINEIALYAYKEYKPEQSELTIPEWLLWYRLRDVYRDCRNDPERGKREKDVALTRYELDRSHWVRVSEVYKVLAQQWKDIEGPARTFAFDQTVENAVKFFEAVYKVPLKTQVEVWKEKEGDTL